MQRVCGSWRWRTDVVMATITGTGVVACLVYLSLTNFTLSTFDFQRVGDWFESDQYAAFSNDGCDCMWRISCPVFRWQVNFTSPNYKCGFEQLDKTAVNTCLERRHARRGGRAVTVRVAGHIREAFLVDYIARRLDAGSPDVTTCRLVTSTQQQHNATETDDVEYYRVLTPSHSSSCHMIYKQPHITLEFKFISTLNRDVFDYISSIEQYCSSEGCHGDLLIISAGAGELLESTLMDSFAGVRRFQKQFKKLLPKLIALRRHHKMQVVWKIHEPVTDELIPEGSLVRNDLLQEYNALIMEQTVLSAVHVWTSHMLMKLHHIESCSLLNDTAVLNSAQWRCEQEWVSGDLCHDDLFDTIFNTVCDHMIDMPHNPCCSA